MLSFPLEIVLENMRNHDAKILRSLFHCVPAEHKSLREIERKIYTSTAMLENLVLNIKRFDEGRNLLTA